MNILYIAPISGPITGLSLASKVFLGELQRSHHVKVLDYSKGGLVHGVNSFERILQVFKLFQTIIKIKSKYDVIYMTMSQSISGNIKDNLILFLLLAQLPITILHLHGGGIRKHVYDRSKYLSHLARILLSRVNTIIVLGESLKTIFRNIVEEEKIKVVNNFAEPALFNSKDKIIKKYDEMKTINILFLSNLIHGKGHEELFNAYKTIPGNIQKKITINYAGHFSTVEEEEKFLKKIQGYHNVKYHGPVDLINKCKLFDENHIYCLPTYYKYEGQPISIIEAYASGCAVITTNHAGIKDIFDDRINGFYVKRKSPESIKEILCTLSSQKNKLKSIGLNNNARAKRYYTQKTFLSNMVTIIEQPNRKVVKYEK
jgi:glycosyltransferase involved in cell wall biosynthesis